MADHHPETHLEVAASDFGQLASTQQIRLRTRNTSVHAKHEWALDDASEDGSPERFSFEGATETGVSEATCARVEATLGSRWAGQIVDVAI